MMRGWVWCGIGVCALIALCTLEAGTARAGSLEDLMLQKGQMSIDEWVELKAEEEKREAKVFEESRGVGDTPVKPKWYEKISIRGYAQLRYNRLGNPNGNLINDQGDKSIGDNNGFFLRRARVIISGEVHERLFVYIQPDFASTVGGTSNAVEVHFHHHGGDHKPDHDRHRKVDVTVPAELHITQDLNESGGRLSQEHPDDHTESHPDRQIAFEWIQSLRFPDSRVLRRLLVFALHGLFHRVGLHKDALTNQ